MAEGSLVSDGGFRLVPLANGWVVGRFAALEAIGIPHAVTTRQGPDVLDIRDNPAVAGRRIAEALGLSDVAFLEQVHGGQVRSCEAGGLAGRGDGLLTTAPSLALLGKSADCPLVLIAERQGRVVGFAHASWRATVAGIVPTLVARMGQAGCPARDLVAAIGPSAGPECYEVGPEVRTAAMEGLGPHAADFFRPGLSGKDHFDLWAANIHALVAAGVAREAIHVAGICTLCRNDLFPSYRCEGPVAGRFAAVIARPQ